MPFTVAIIGRPNVGKSTLFNRLTGKRHAIVDNTPGVTRDRREGDAKIGELDFRLIDTAGLEDSDDNALEGRMRQQTEHAVRGSNLALFMIDGRAGLTPIDEYFAGWLRAQETPVLLLANKCEGAAGESGRFESYALGFGDPLAISAEHGQGLSDLYDAIKKLVKTPHSAIDDKDPPDLSEDDPTRPLSLAIVGRPNVGKSTMVNYLLGEDRMLTGPEAGITRDAIAVPWSWEDQKVQLVDTAGIRRQAKVNDKLERLSVQDSLRAVQYAEVVMLVLDSNAVLEKQDLTIARKVIEAGRALIIVVNKWDLVNDRKESLSRLSDRLNTSLPQVRGIPIVTFSAHTGHGMARLMPAVFEIYQIMLEVHPPPVVSGRRLRLRYITQVKTRPPTFAIFSTRADKVPESYLRYLANGLREDFGLTGVAIRLNTRKRKNPYHDKPN